MFFKIAPKVTLYLGYFCTKISAQSFRAQSGHTDHHLLLTADYWDQRCKTVLPQFFKFVKDKHLKSSAKITLCSF